MTRCTFIVFVGIIGLMAGCSTPGATPGDTGGTDTTVTGPRLLVKTWTRVLTFKRDASLGGDQTPAAILSGSQTKLTTYGEIEVTKANQLLVSDGGIGLRYTGAIHLFPDTTKLDGNQTPSAEVAGDQTSFGNSPNPPDAIALDRQADMLYVGVRVTENGFPAGKILVFNKVSESGFNGNIPPDRILSDKAWASGFQGLYVAKDTLFVATGGAVRAYTNASLLKDDVATAPGGIAPGEVGGIFVDANNRLYVVSGSGRSPTRVFRYDDAAGIRFDPATQSAPPVAATFEMPTGLFPRSITLDSSGTGYVAEEGHSSDPPPSVFIFDHIDTRAGATTQDRQLTWGPISSGNNPAAAVIAVD